MSIVVDTNCMASVFKPNSADHDDFFPILQWIIKGKGKLVVGGSMYLSEVQHYIGFISELSKVNKVVKVPTNEVDSETDKLKDLISHRDYDDPHLIALLSVSQCKLICSKDQRAYPFFKDRNFYKNKTVPSIYTNKKHAEMLSDFNMAEICKPCEKLRKRDAELIMPKK